MKKPFRPSFLPIELEDKDTIEILKLENEARAKVQRFDSILERSIIKKELLILFSMKESVQSTKIEGTEATFGEVMESKATGNSNDDIVEVLNYHDAISEGSQMLRRLPISTRMLLELHKTILKNSRGKNRNPGSYRTIQNFIGPTEKIEDATYIPPEPNLVPEYMENLEKYINDEYGDNFGYISKAAIIHGQFESIHPFLDGNGRIGRILIIIYLLEKGIISQPAFFVSEELEKSKFKYYALLNGLRKEKPDWKEWIVYFLNASIKQANMYIEKLLAIESLHRDMLEIAKECSISESAILFIFDTPVFTVKRMEKSIGVSYNTANRYVKELVKRGKLFGDDRKRNRTYSFYDLIETL